MPAPKELLQIQLGKESTWGTSVAATAKLMGVEDWTITPIVQTGQYEDLRAAIAPSYLSAVEYAAAKASISGIVTYEDGAYLLDSLFSVATPSGANPYTRAYTGPTTAVTTPRSNTIIAGDATNQYKVAGAVLEKLTLSFTNNGPWKFSSDWIGKVVTTGALAALSDRAVTPVMGHHTTLFIDNFAATIGTTSVASTAFAGEMTFTPNRKLYQYLGSVTPGAYSDNTWETELKLSLEYNATSKAYVDAIVAATPARLQKLVRVSADSTASNQFRVDFAGVTVDAPDLFQDRDGAIFVDLVLKGEVDTGSFGNFVKATSINTVSTLA